MKENNYLYLAFIGIVVIVGITAITLSLNTGGKYTGPPTSRIEVPHAQQDPLVGQAYVAKLSTSSQVEQANRYPISEGPVGNKLPWRNSPPAQMKGGEQNPRACLNLDTLKDNEGNVALGMEHQIYTDDMGRPAIKICPYDFFVNEISVIDDGLNIYCIYEGSINGPGHEHFTAGFNGQDEHTFERRISDVKNCVITNFFRGIYDLKGQIRDNIIKDNRWGISGCYDSIITDNTIFFDSYSAYGGIINTHGYIGRNTINVLFYGISAGGTIEDNVIYSINEGISLSSPSVVRNNYLSAGHTGIEVRPQAHSTYQLIGNEIHTNGKGIYIQYWPYNPFNGYLSIQDNTIQSSTPNIARAIVVNGSNTGSVPILKIDNNRIINAMDGIYLKNDIQDASIGYNDITASNYALGCFRGQGITWTCNDCNNGAVFNDQCNPQAFCEVCGGGPGTPGPGGSPIMKKEILPVEMRPR